MRFWDQICPKKVFWGRKLRKKLTNSESTVWNNPVDQVSFKKDQSEV